MCSQCIVCQMRSFLINLNDQEQDNRDRHQVKQVEVLVKVRVLVAQHLSNFPHHKNLYYILCTDIIGQCSLMAVRTIVAKFNSTSYKVRNNKYATSSYTCKMKVSGRIRH